ncbi:MAG: protein kinase, partial [Myxococcales bacterium]|nr:protein kinase [Myxococcales bacterium]
MAEEILEGPRGRYRVGRELGRGGFGVTRAGVRERDGLAVAVKTLRIEQLASWKALELFEREAAVLRTLDHPGVVRYVDDFALPGDAGFALVQELVPGPTLAAVMARGERLAPAAMAGLLKALLETCAYLHGLSPPVIHRDITPKNVILREPDGAPILIDFGTVQAAVARETGVASTAAGTFGYAPLEQFVGRATAASDLYGLAMTWLGSASGQTPDQMPFRGNRVQVREVLGGAAVDARVLLALEEMTEPDAARRASSARAVLARIEAVPASATGVLIPGRAPVVSAPLPTSGAGAAAVARYHALAELSRRVPPSARLALDVPGALDGFRAAAVDARGGYVLLDDLSRLTLPELALLAAPEDDTPWRGAGSLDTLLLADGAAAVRGMFDDKTLFVFDARGGVASTCALEPAKDVRFDATGFGRAAALRPDHAVLAYVSRTSRGVLFDAATGKVTRTFEVPPGIDLTFIEMDELRFTPDGGALALDLRYRGSLMLGADGDHERNPFGRVAFSADGRRAAIATEKRLELTELLSTSPLRFASRSTVWEADDDLSRLRFSPDGALLAALSRDRRLVVIDVAAGAILGEVLQAHRPGARFEGVEAFGFSADDRVLVVLADAAPTPSAREAERVLTFYAVGDRRSTATLGRAGDDGLALVTAEGITAPLSGKATTRQTAARRLALGATPDDAIPGPLREPVAELGARVAFWAAL